MLAPHATLEPGDGKPSLDFTKLRPDGIAATLDAEIAVLGILLNEPSATPSPDQLDPEDFFGFSDGQSLHGRIFAAFQDDLAAGVESSLHLMQSRFSGELEVLEQPYFLANAWDKAPPTSALPGLVTKIAADAVQRRLLRALARPGAGPELLNLIVQAEAGRLDRLSKRGRVLRATPFAWVEPSAIPQREWLYDKHLIRRFVSATFAAGGTGKTTLIIAEALAMATGRPLLGARVAKPLTVWLVNLEDPREEIERRVVAACLHHGIHPSELEGRLFIDSGREASLVIARGSRNGVEVCAPCVRQLEREIADRGIDVVIIDPFVACHEVPENDNGAVNQVVKEWAGIADRTACAVELVHHIRKPATGQTEVSVEDGRGASALLSGVRSARVLNLMSEAQAAEWGIEERRSFVRMDNGKSNLAPPAATARWRRLVSVDLENGPTGFSDQVAVATLWEPPGAFDSVKSEHLHEVQRLIHAGQYRASDQAKGWAGQAVAEVLGWDLDDKRDKLRVKSLLRTWCSQGLFKTEMRTDDRRVQKPHLVVGRWAE